MNNPLFFSTFTLFLQENCIFLPTLYYTFFMPGTLYLIPTPLGNTPHTRIFPELNAEIIQTLDHFIVENLRSARRFLRSTGYYKDFYKVKLF